MKYIKIIFFFFLNTADLFSQPQPGLSVSFVLEDDSLYAFDPWQVNVIITNVSPNPIKCFPISSESGIVNRVGYINIEVLSNRDSIWHSTGQIINRADHNGCTLFPPEPNQFLIEIDPNESTMATYLMPPPTVPLAYAGRVKLRVSYFLPGYPVYIYSAEQDVYLKGYEMQDNLAYQYLRTLPRPNFLYYPLYPSVAYDKSDLERAEYIMEHFRESRFAEYSKLYLTQAYIGMAWESGKFKDTSQIVYFLRKSKKYGAEILKSEKPKLVKKCDEIMGQMAMALYYSFDAMPPQSLLEEFTYPPKN